MKASFHLFYGIIIGMLIIACTGSDSTSNTATPTSSIADQKSFNEIHRVFWDEDENAFHKTVLLKYGDRASWNPGGKIVDAPQGSPDALRKAGWTIIDMELHGGNIPHYLVGK